MNRCCAFCRYWSDQLAHVGSDSLMRAACLSLDSPNAMVFTHVGQSCRDWAHNDLGAIDEPGRDPARYQDEERTS